MVLESRWFFLWGLLWAVYFMTDGFDLGLGTLMPFLAKTEEDKRVIVTSMGPLWDGNEVWLLTAGGVTFAAFPMVYAVMFSSLYSALMLILFALILRGVAFEFRSKVDSDNWRKVWDACIFIGSAAPALLFGVAFANIFRGIPIDQNGIFQGNLFTLLNPYGLLGGLLFLAIFLVHGRPAPACGVYRQQAMAGSGGSGRDLSGRQYLCHPAIQQLSEQPDSVCRYTYHCSGIAGDKILPGQTGLFQSLVFFSSDHCGCHLLRCHRVVPQYVSIQY